MCSNFANELRPFAPFLHCVFHQQFGLLLFFVISCLSLIFFLPLDLFSSFLTLALMCLFGRLCHVFARVAGKNKQIDREKRHIFPSYFALGSSTNIFQCCSLVRRSHARARAHFCICECVCMCVCSHFGQFTLLFFSSFLWPAFVRLLLLRTYFLRLNSGMQTM